MEPIVQIDSSKHGPARCEFDGAKAKKMVFYNETFSISRTPSAKITAVQSTEKDSLSTRYRFNQRRGAYSGAQLP